MSLRLAFCFITALADDEYTHKLAHGRCFPGKGGTQTKAQCDASCGSPAKGTYECWQGT